MRDNLVVRDMLRHVAEAALESGGEDSLYNGGVGQPRPAMFSSSASMNRIDGIGDGVYPDFMPQVY